MNGGAIGVSGYAGIGISSLGWGIQEDFEQFVDPPPTVDSVRTSSFSSHPSKPLFLVGSSNTHIYLWEVGDCYEKMACRHNFSCFAPNGTLNHFTRHQPSS